MGTGMRKLLLIILAVILWIAYFVICSAPSGAPFIYEDF